MKIHLRQIPAEGLHLAGEEDCPIPQLDPEEAQCAGPLRYALDVGISEGALWANGALTQPVELRCVRCLESFMREDILLNLPAYPHCDREGGRVCPVPMATKTDEDKGVLEARPPDWSALDKLKIRKS